MRAVTRRRTCAPGPLGRTACGPASSACGSRLAAPSTAPWGSAWPAGRRATTAWRWRTSVGAPWRRWSRARCTTAAAGGAWRKRRTASASTGAFTRLYKVCPGLCLGITHMEYYFDYFFNFWTLQSLYKWSLPTMLQSFRLKSLRDDRV